MASKNISDPQRFERSIHRRIDHNTLEDLLSLLEFEDARLRALELELGYGIHADSMIGVLFGYVLDALHWPASHRHREQAYEIFFDSDDSGECLTVAERLTRLANCRQLS